MRLDFCRKARFGCGCVKPTSPAKNINKINNLRLAMGAGHESIQDEITA